jgi:DNA-binding NtrC family response regulator
MGETLSRDAGGYRSGEALNSARLMLILSTTADSRIVELCGKPVTVGRGDGADVVVAEPSLSRVHARFQRNGDVVKVQDLGSRNGTVVNGKRVEQAEMRSGDVAVLGNVVACLQLAPPTHAAILGLSSFEAIRDRIEHECARARTFRRPLSVVFFRADEAIGEGTFASSWASTLRFSDLAGIYDAGSILVLLPETDASSAELLARDLVSATASKANVVAGIASYPESAFTPDQLLAGAIAAAAQASGRDRIAVAPTAVPVRPPESNEPIRKSQAMQDIQRLIERVAPESAPVLVLGETGTGKELVARELHRQSPPRSGPLKVVNCAALSDSLLGSVLFGHVRGAFPGADHDQPGVFEKASGGTVFLDEIGELPAGVQAALLRVLETDTVLPVGGDQEVRVDVRVVAATHRRLDEMVAQGTFRRDLFQRLGTFTVRLPPLRERREEIAPLVAEFIRRLSPGDEPPKVAAEAMELLERYAWPGNVRELKNVVERALMLADSGVIGPAELPKHVAGAATDHAMSPRNAAESEPLPDLGIDLRTELQRHEAGLIIRALQKTNGHQRRAAALLKLPLRTFERKIKDLGLNRAGLS